MKKKVLIVIAIIFAAITIQFLFANKVQAYTKYNSEISYEENYSGTITVAATGKYIESATIPSTINGKKVTTIASSGFEDCQYLKTVTLPNTITKIESSAFKGCKALTSINIPDSVKMIDYWSFENCSSVKSIFLKNVTEISPYAFDGCSSLSSVTFSNNLTKIGEAAFRNCSALKGVSLPSKLEYLGASVFEASGLTSITIPSSVTTMRSNYGAFENCKSLKTATINASIKEIPYNLFKDCTALTTVKFSASSPIETAESSTFENCTSLTSVTLPTKLTNLSNRFFKDCTSLTNITIPDSVKEVDYYAFENCTKLATIKFPCGVQTLKPYVFMGCTALKNVYFTKSIQEIDSNTFYNIPTSQVTIWGYSGTAAKYFAQEKGYTYKECTPVTKISISGANSVLKKSTITLTANITPSSAFNKSVLWTSSNTNVATVDQSGKVTGKGSGTVTITAKAKDGTEVKGTYTITVKLTDMPFKDVTVDNWFYTAVEYTYKKGIILGTSSTTFNPNTKLTRGMLVTILHRMEGKPTVNVENKFKDVYKSQYYYDAVKWAAAKGIVHGYDNGKFGPDNTITRQDLAVILRNYAQYKGKNTNVTANLGTFKDGSIVSNYAKTAMQWAVGKGVITGNSDNNTLTPHATSTRAEAASMLYKYCTKVK